MSVPLTISHTTLLLVQGRHIPLFFTLRKTRQSFGPARVRGAVCTCALYILVLWVVPGDGLPRVPSWVTFVIYNLNAKYEAL